MSYWALDCVGSQDFVCLFCRDTNIVLLVLSFRELIIRAYLEFFCVDSEPASFGSPEVVPERWLKTVQLLEVIITWLDMCMVHSPYSKF